MLLSLHVKNLALIEEEEISFGAGLNILTGETGAGKSVVIGSIGLALGDRADAGIIRTGAEYALIEAVFAADSEEQKQRILAMDVPLEEDGTLFIKRRIYPGRSSCMVSGETVSVRQLREIGDVLIDVYGQRENQRLLRKENQLLTLDEFAGEKTVDLRHRTEKTARKLHELESAFAEDDLDESQRMRELDLCRYEISEIENANLKEGEDEQLESRYRQLESHERLMAAAAAAGGLTGGEDGSADTQIAHALRQLSALSGVDPALDDITSQLADIDSLLADFGRAISDYADELTFDPGEFEEVTQRLDLINHLKGKYGKSIPEILAALEARRAREEELTGYDRRRQELLSRIEETKQELRELCLVLSKDRREAGTVFSEKMRDALSDLNFAHVEFETDIRSDETHLTADGMDHVRFLISMNEGEALRPLDQIASGGELSRIMLALKTVFAGREETPTFVFDEIDSGISGQTAWKVAEKMGRLAGRYQILCITHLPQIAAMEDVHFRIRKETADGRTRTSIEKLGEEESLGELARLLGGDTVTEAGLANAREMRENARRAKGALQNKE